MVAAERAAAGAAAKREICGAGDQDHHLNFMYMLFVIKKTKKNETKKTLNERENQRIHEKVMAERVCLCVFLIFYSMLARYLCVWV